MTAMPSTLLALDASTEVCSVALSHQGQCFSRTCTTPKSHAKVILPMVQELLSEADITSQDIQTILVALGPGSFTGIRICLSIAQGLAYGLSLPLYGLSTLELLAETMKQDLPVGSILIPALDARMAEVYWAAYQVSESGFDCIHDTNVSSPDQLNQYCQNNEGVMHGAGHGWKVADAELLQTAKPELFPSAEALISLALSKDESFWQQDAQAMALEPMYLRNEVAWEKRVRIREQGV